MSFPVGGVIVQLLASCMRAMALFVASVTPWQTKSPAIARKSRPYRLRPKPSVQISVTKRKRFVRGETVPCTLC